MQTSQLILLGYTLDLEGYICYNPLTKKSIVSRHVLFHENVFPFTVPVVHSTSPTPTSSSDPISLVLTFYSVSPSALTSAPPSSPSTNRKVVLKSRTAEINI